MPTAKHRIVIVGAGFVGLPAARHLRRSLPDADIVLVDKKDHFLFTPRLIDLLALEQPGTEYAADLAAVAKRDGFRFIRGEAVRVDRNGKTVELRTSDGREDRVAYDAVVLCQGVKPAYFHIPGAEEHGLPLKTRDDVVRLHARVAEQFGKARHAASPAAKALLSFVTVGAGPTGIESLFSLKAYVERYADRHAPDLKPHVSFAIVQAAPQILPGFLPSVVDAARDALRRKRIDVFEGDPVTRVEPDAVHTAVGRRIPYGLLLWCAGVEANAIGMSPEALTDRAGCVVTDGSLHVSDNVFAAGDAVAFADRNLAVPKNAQTALLMSGTVAVNVARILRSRPLVRFRYTSKGNLLVFGCDDGVIQIGRFTIRTGLAKRFRDAFYRLRERQVTGGR